MLGFLFVDEASFALDPADAAKLLETEDGQTVVRAAREALAALDELDDGGHRGGAARRRSIEELGLKPRNAFGPVRVAVTGRRVSPPLFESLELLGRERSLARLDGAVA